MKSNNKSMKSNLQSFNVEMFADINGVIKENGGIAEKLNGLINIFKI